MSAFLSPVRMEILPPSQVKGRQKYRLLEPFVYDSNLLGRIEIPAGFLTDFASIPRILWRYLDPEDSAIQFASLVHDYLYFTQPCSREVADKVMVEAMEISGARWDQRVVAYRAVRLFGGSHWKTI